MSLSILFHSFAISINLWKNWTPSFQEKCANLSIFSRFFLSGFFQLRIFSWFAENSIHWRANPAPIWFSSSFWSHADIFWFWTWSSWRRLCIWCAMPIVWTCRWTDKWKWCAPRTSLSSIIDTLDTCISGRPGAEIGWRGQVPNNFAVWFCYLAAQSALFGVCFFCWLIGLSNLVFAVESAFLAMMVGQGLVVHFIFFVGGAATCWSVFYLLWFDHLIASFSLNQAQFISQSPISQLDERHLSSDFESDVAASPFIHPWSPPFHWPIQSYLTLFCVIWTWKSLICQFRRTTYWYRAIAAIPLPRLLFDMEPRALSNFYFQNPTFSLVASP